MQDKDQPGRQVSKDTRNTRLFQVMAKDNFQVKYQKQPRDKSTPQRGRMQSEKRPRIDLGRFETHFQNTFIPPDAESIYNPSSRSNGFSQSGMSATSRNTARFQKKQSYYFQEELQHPFMKSISNSHSFAFKSLPRHVIQVKEVEQSNERLQQILRREDYKYTISPLVQQELFQEGH